MQSNQSVLNSSHEQSHSATYVKGRLEKSSWRLEWAAQTVQRLEGSSGTGRVKGAGDSDSVGLLTDFFCAEREK
jgi:hypothetical protein